MKLGLSEKHLQLIVEVLKQANIDRAVVFGSRAAQLDELPMPYKFDIVDYNSINSCALREHIDRVGIEIYKK